MAAAIGPLPGRYRNVYWVIAVHIYNMHLLHVQSFGQVEAQRMYLCWVLIGWHADHVIHVACFDWLVVLLGYVALYLLMQLDVDLDSDYLITLKMYKMTQ